MMMKLRYLIRFVLLVVSVVALIAPFTFLKPSVDPTLEKGKATTKKVRIEKPLHNVKLPKFSNIKDIKAKKSAFFGFLKPYVTKANAAVLAKRKKLLTIERQVQQNIALTEKDVMFVNTLASEYRVKNTNTTAKKIDQLLNRVDMIPMPLVLVQAANESAWGSSRFARIGLNFFGMWCFKKGCGMVPNSRTEGKSHEVAAFQSVDEVVTRYIHNLNVNQAYKLFRIIRRNLRDKEQPLQAKVLATGLLPYSERGYHYVNELLQMLKHNQRYIQPQ